MSFSSDTHLGTIETTYLLRAAGDAFKAEFA